MTTLKKATFRPRSDYTALLFSVGGVNIRAGQTFEYDPSCADAKARMAGVSAATPGIDGASCFVEVTKAKSKRTPRQVKPAAATPAE